MSLKNLSILWTLILMNTLIVGPSCAETGSSVKGVDFLTRDGMTIRGSYYPPPKGPAPAVILLHMLNRNRHDWNPLATRLQGLGLALLSIDLRGHGESTDQGGRTLLWNAFSEADFNKMVLDIEAAQLFLGRQKGEVEGDKLALVGASIGCNVALNFAADHPEVRTLVLLSPGLDYRGIHADLAMKRYSASRRPVLIAVSGEDDYAADSSRKLKDLSIGHSELILYQGAGHGTRMFAKEKDLEERIVRWLKEIFHPL